MMTPTHILRVLIDLLAGEVVLVQGEVIVVLTQRQVVHLTDEIFKLRIFFAGELLDLLPDFLALCILFSFSGRRKVGRLGELSSRMTSN